MDGTVSGEDSQEVLHALFYHFIAQVWDLRTWLGETLPAWEISRFKHSRATFMGLQVAAVVAGQVLLVMIRVLGQWTYEGLKTSCRRLGPDALLDHTPLLNYILDREERLAGMSTTRQIINNASDAILALDSSLVIESVNQAAQRILRYSPEQMLGQHMKLLFSDEIGELLTRQTQMMVRHECGRQFAANWPVLTETDAEVPALVILLGLTTRRSQAISHFVLTVRDQSESMAQQREAERAKERSEELLYAILPRDIVMRLNQGERDVCFVVASATLCFVDIQKFSAYAAQLTPQETFRNLGTIFNGYDKQIVKYDLCYKMKYVGDGYMMAAGLFTPSAEPQRHAEQSVRFALDCLQVIEEVNLALTANLAVRIGINTGGPLVAGVLGTDRPLFDILGDPINIAARLQSSDVPGKVQISEDTYGLVREQGFSIESRGEIMLKGKGMRPAYLVSPPGQAGASPLAGAVTHPLGRQRSLVRAGGSPGLDLSLASLLEE